MILKWKIMSNKDHEDDDNYEENKDSVNNEWSW